MLHYGRVAIAFSGGVDSSFLLKKALDTLGAGNVLVLFGQSVLLTEDEITRARNWLQLQGYPEGVVMESVDLHCLSWKEFVQNTEDRCYLCKLRMYKIFREIMVKNDFPVLLDGTNADDLKVNRPGLRAIHELGVKTPLVKAGFDKNEIRQCSKKMGLQWDLPSSSCLATRIPYGLEITRARIDRIARWEKRVKNTGFSDCRVRLVKEEPETVYIQVAEADMALIVNPNIRIALLRFFANQGIVKVYFDLEGR